MSTRENMRLSARAPLMFKLLPKSKYPTGMLYFLTDNTSIIYLRYIKGSKRIFFYRLEKWFEKDLVHFISDSIFKRLEFATHLQRLFQTRK